MAACEACRSGKGLDFGIRTAFQPIFDIRTGEVFAYEALVRGTEGEGASEILARVTQETLYSFDQACRVAAIKNAARTGILETGARLSINFMPNAVYSPLACIRLTLETARQVGMPEDRLIFEFTENERLDPAHVKTIIEAYRKLGFATALDDFGAGYAGLNLLADLPTDIVKLDMELIRGIDQSEPRRQITFAMIRLLEEMGRMVIAEGIETRREMDALAELGVHYMQGFLLAPPMLDTLQDWPARMLKSKVA
ncbi:EAL domain-containing protein [Aurantiacibacter poecillastricola]|uniref:EAL domain-containing protein n=1 Tax=Aurantiacibacter poecillastricola TaxID=3064385 RepID=UPI00273E29E6|nr:EAL domain-containing protein [Aurantiacibacter sp. 219JJ12-13]MDP5261689.1 EAL domain-containing protein [Aurantiacibacter sp. 219JJ12-13]